MAESDISEPNFSDLSQISGLSQILKNDDSIANRVRDLLEEHVGLTKPIILQGMDSGETTNGSSSADNENPASADKDDALKSENGEREMDSKQILVPETISTDDMLSISGATEYQDLPEVSGNSTGNGVTTETPQVQTTEPENASSVESIAKIAGTVKYYLESDPNTPQLVAEQEKLNNLMKYMEGENQDDVKKTKETPVLLQKSGQLVEQKMNKSISEEQKSTSQEESEMSDVHVSPLPVKREAWGTESVSSVEDNLTARVRKTLEGSTSPAFGSIPPGSTVLTDTTSNKKAYFSLPTSPREGDQSLESIDSLANHVKSLLTTRAKSASPFSMLHHTDREQLKSPNKAPQDAIARSSFTGNLSQEIRNFENTDLWKFARQFMPGEKPSTTTERKSYTKKIETPNSSVCNFDTSSVSQTPSMTNILKRIHETTLPDENITLNSSLNQSIHENSMPPSNSPPSRLKISPSGIPMYKSYRNSKSPIQVKKSVLEEYKKKSPTAGARPPFHRIFPSKSDSFFPLNHDISYSTPLQTKIDSIDCMNTSSLLKYKVDFPSTTVTPFQIKSFNGGKPKMQTTSASVSNEYLSLDKPMIAKSSTGNEFKIPPGVSTLEFPRSSYLREKIGLKPLKKPKGKAETTMHLLQGEICDATPLPSKERPITPKEDFVFCTPKVSAYPPRQTRQHLHSPPGSKPVTILPTYDQLVVHDSLKKVTDKKELECLHYSLNDTTPNVAVTQSTPFFTNDVATSYSRANYSTPQMSLFEETLSRHESDCELQRRTLSLNQENKEESPEITTHSLKPSITEDVSRVSFNKSIDNDEEIFPNEPVQNLQQQVANSMIAEPTRAKPEVVVPTSPPLPYVRLKQDGTKDAAMYCQPPTVQTISTKKVQSILLKEQSLQNKSNSQKISPKPQRKKASNINTSDPNVVLKKDLESLLNLFEEKAPIITEILKRIHDSSLQKQKEETTSTETSSKLATKKSQSTQTVTEKDVEIYEASNTAREVACQAGTTLKSKPKKGIVIADKENILTQTLAFENQADTNKFNIPVQNKKQTEKPTGFFVQVEKKKEIPKKDSKVTKSTPVAWFEPFQYEPPWMYKESKPSYGYVNSNVQDAFLENKRDFVLRSWERQEDIQIRAERRKILEIEENIKQRFEEMQRANNKRQTVVREPHFEKSKPLEMPVKQPKKKDTTFKELFAKSRKAYLKLPEVKSQREKQKRMDSYKENRIKAQVYKVKIQKGVLNKNRS